MKHKVKYIKLYSVALVIALVLGGLAVYMPLTYAENNSPEKNNSMKQAVAQRLYNMVSEKIDKILNLADEYGINISNFTENIDMANNFLNNASNYIKSNSTLSIKLSIKAMLVFSPVVRYVTKNLPHEAKVEMENNSLKNAIDVKMYSLKKLNNTVSWLENKSIPVPYELPDMINKAYNNLTMAYELVNSGNYSVSQVAHLIADASKLIGQGTALLYRHTGGVWGTFCLADHSMKKILYNTVNLAKGINRTINLLNNSEASDEVVNRISVIANDTYRLNQYVYKAYNMSVKISGEENNYTKALKTLSDALNISYPLINQAITEIEDGNISSAINELQAASNIIMNGINNVAPLFKHFHNAISNMRSTFMHVKGRFRDAMKNMMLHDTAKMMFHIHKLDVMLKIAYNKYQHGRMTKTQFLAILDNIKTNLNTMNNQLSSMKHPPRMLMNRIQELLNWINRIESEMQ